MKSKLSIFTLIAIFSWISIYRLSNVNKSEISWDVLGYYIYLPSTFIYHQPLLNNDDWLKKINDEKHITGTLYQVSSNDQGQPMYFFLMGTALLYLPFFLTSHWLAHIMGYPADGFSMPYQYGLVVGCILYAFIALFYLRKVLKYFFSETITSLVLLLVVFGTNYCHYCTLGNLTQPNMLFMLVAILLWHTIKWREDQKGKHIVVIGVCITLMALIKPTEAVIAILPLLWGVNSLKNLGDKFRLLSKNYKAILLCIGICLLIIMPQMLYWHVKTGKFIYDTYKNPGVGLDFLSPHIFNTLFSYRKGWLLYTPIMIFSLLGFVLVYKNNRPVFWAITGYFLVTFYIIASWTEWWYGGSYSCRPVVTAYPVLSVSLGYFLQYVFSRRIGLKLLFGMVASFFIFLNQFQWWQLNHWLLDPYRTTGKYYWAIFLKTHRDLSDCDYMLVERNFSGHQVLEDEDTARYVKRRLILWTFDTMKSPYVQKDSTGNFFYHMPSDQEFTPMSYRKKISDLTDKDHFWVEAEADIRFPKGFTSPEPDIVMTTLHKDACYCYYADEIKDSIKDGAWHRYKWYYLSPDWRSTKDEFQCYIWKRGQQSFDIDNFQLNLYAPKQ